mmetsp:Transcript_12540/g.41559  ORF Transcript_12540/g.41559 Transcript_12540/m.41559 type:complete len:226 (-) Transcript_12540:174-851(-)
MCVQGCELYYPHEPPRRTSEMWLRSDWMEAHRDDTRSLRSLLLGVRRVCGEGAVAPSRTPGKRPDGGRSSLLPQGQAPLHVRAVCARGALSTRWRVGPCIDAELVHSPCGTNHRRAGHATAHRESDGGSRAHVWLSAVRYWVGEEHTCAKHHLHSGDVRAIARRALGQHHCSQALVQHVRTGHRLSLRRPLCTARTVHGRCQLAINTLKHSLVYSIELTPSSLNE